MYKQKLTGLLFLFFGCVQALYADPLHDMFAKTLVEAEEGAVTSMYDLARMYELGVGTERSVQEAMVWYQQAALKGNARAGFRLGEIYYNGEGEPRDYAAAHKWFLKAAEDGNQDTE